MTPDSEPRLPTPRDDGLLNYDAPLPGKRDDYQTIATFSAEQTARFLGGGEIGEARYTDAEMQELANRQKALLRKAFSEISKIVDDALDELSPTTRDRFVQLAKGAMDGDMRAIHLYGTMLAELAKLGLMPSE